MVRARAVLMATLTLTIILSAKNAEKFMILPKMAHGSTRKCLTQPLDVYKRQAYGGIELLQQTVENLLNIPIDYYALIDFAGFEDVVDALGGVEIEVDKRMYYQTYDGLIDIEAGVQRLDGEKALQYVRFRADSLGDITRVSRQQTLMKAIVHEFVENNGYWKLPQLLPAINRAVETNLSTLNMVRLAFLAKDLDLDALESATLEGDFMLLNEISYWQVDEAALQALVATRFGGGH